VTIVQRHRLELILCSFR